MRFPRSAWLGFPVYVVPKTVALRGSEALHVGASSLICFHVADKALHVPSGSERDDFTLALPVCSRRLLFARTQLTGKRCTHLRSTRRVMASTSREDFRLLVRRLET